MREIPASQCVITSALIRLANLALQKLHHMVFSSNTHLCSSLVLHGSMQCQDSEYDSQDPYNPYIKMPLSQYHLQYLTTDEVKTVVASEMATFFPT